MAYSRGWNCLGVWELSLSVHLHCLSKTKGVDCQVWVLNSFKLLRIFIGENFLWPAMICPLLTINIDYCVVNTNTSEVT